MTQEQLGLASGLLVVILTAIWPMFSSMMPVKGQATEEHSTQGNPAGEIKSGDPAVHASPSESGVPAISTSFGKSRKSPTAVVPSSDPHSGGDAHSGPDLGGPN